MILKPTIEQLRKSFYPHPMPNILEDLLTFDTESPQWYSLGFEVAIISPAEIGVHIVKEAIPQFFAFGHDGNYSLYALWRYKEMLLENAPVVYLNSEAEGSRVLANNLSAFLTLLACDEEPIFGEYPDTPDEEKEHSPRHQKFL